MNSFLDIELWQVALMVLLSRPLPQVLNILLRCLPQVFQIEIPLLILMILNSIILVIDFFDSLLGQSFFSHDLDLFVFFDFDFFSHLLFFHFLKHFFLF